MRLTMARYTDPSYPLYTLPTYPTAPTTPTTQVAAQMYAVALEPNVLTVRYVSLKKFLGFMTKLYTHNGYASASVRKHRYVHVCSVQCAVAHMSSCTTVMRL